MRRSALIARLERYLDLTPDERDALDGAERRERRIGAGQTLTEQGSDNDLLFVVQHGWLHSSTRLKLGGRQILGFHYPGDLIGTSSIAWRQAATTLTAVSDCIIFELSKPNLGRLFKAQPRLAGLLYAMAAAENVAMSDRLAALGRMGAVERLTVLLLDMLARLRVTAGGVVDSFELPLTQRDIGDAVGLTKVHVSRTLSKMERDGMIERNAGRVRVLNERALAEQVGFVDRYAEVDTHWLPPHQAAA